MMKSSVCLAILFIGVVCVLACDPDGDNKPACIASNLYVAIRNFWDPTHYWNCTSVGAEAESMQCPLHSGFQADKQDCVHFRDWQWTPPCPAETSD